MSTRVAELAVDEFKRLLEETVEQKTAGDVWRSR